MDSERTPVSLVFTLFKHSTKRCRVDQGVGPGAETFSSTEDPAALLGSHADRSVVPTPTSVTTNAFLRASGQNPRNGL